MSATPDTEKMVDHLFRHCAGKMVAVLTRVLGLHELQMVEDVVQDAFIKALQSWKIHGIPDNPEAWLLQVARNRTIDILRRKQYYRRFTQQQPFPSAEEIEPFFHEQEIADSQLSMVFACCHPLLKQEDQVALTLKIVSSFSMAEIAKALLTNEAAVQKRLSRARHTLKEQKVLLEIPAGKALQERLGSVYAVLYLLFNEGYHSLKPDEPIRRDLCAEAIRCCKLLTEHTAVKEPVAHALLSLMCLHAARFDSRIEGDDTIILLEQQDRSLWDRELIQVGLHYLNLSSSGSVISAYHIESAIAAEHALAPSFVCTNWNHLLQLYDLLVQVNPTPAAWLNRAVVLAQTGLVEQAITSFFAIESIDLLLRNNPIYSAVLGDLYKRNHQPEEAKTYLQQAYHLTPSFAEKKLLQQKLNEIS